MASSPKAKALRHTAQAAAFLLIFVLLLSFVSGVLRGKQYAPATAAFYEEPKDSLDVLFMGSSHMLNAVSPLQLWQEYGIVSNNLAQNGQVLPVSYYALQDALRYQKPQLVVLDVYKVVQDSLIDSSASLHFTLDNMPLGLPKIRAVFDLLPKGERAEYLVDLIAYHTRWKEVSRADLAAPDTMEKGAQALFTTESHPDFTVLPASETAPPAQVAIDYLEKIVALCREESIDLLMVTTPFTTPDDDDLNRQQVVNAMEDYARQWDVPFVNLMHRVEEMDFSFTTDMADVYHVNWLGMEKVTAWLGAYLHENYTLPDRRGDPAYSSWNDALAEYTAYLAQQEATLTAADTSE